MANASGFVGPYVIGVLKGASGSFHSGLLVLALVPLAGAALALRLRRAPVLTAVPRTVATPVGYTQGD